MSGYSKVFAASFGLILLGLTVSTIALDDYVLGKLDGDAWRAQAVGIRMFEAWPLTLFCFSFFGAIVLLIFWLLFEQALNSAIKASDKAIKEKHTNILNNEKNRLEKLESFLNHEIQEVSKRESLVFQREVTVELVTLENEELLKRAKQKSHAADRVKKKFEKKIKELEVLD